MFEGSAHHDSGYFEPLQQAGGTLNGSTNTDRTNYWEVVPANALELALWMESDRMGFLLPALTEEKFANQRDVVLNERRQNYENRPYGMAGLALVRRAVSGRPPVSLAHHRVARRPARRHGRRRPRVLPPLLPPGQRLARHRRRRRCRARAGPGRRVLRRHSRRRAARPRAARAGARGPGAPRDRRPRRTAAALPRLAEPGDVRRRRRRTRSARRRARDGQGLAAVSIASSTTAGSPPTSRPTRARANSAARSRSWPPPCRASRSA